jgi:dihydrofolate synthase/folylpolyglutamate synthase
MDMRSITNFAQAQAALDQFVAQKPQPAGYTLDNIKAFMAYLGDPQNKLKIIHIAGTSGKTSTAYYAAALLTAAGYSTGLTVSPHIDQISERAQINLQALPEAEYCHELSEFLDLVDNAKIELSYFEVLVAFAYWLFDRRGVEYAVVEVGLGGLLDGTNVINRSDKLCVITDIGLDHTAILGGTLAKIAYQKAGIIGTNNAVFINDQPDEVVSVIKASCQKQRATLHVLSPEKTSEDVDMLSKLPLFQKRNMGLALAAVNYVVKRDHNVIMTSSQIKKAAEVYIPGRMEIVHSKGKTLVLDGSHNEQKIQALVESMASQFSDEDIEILVSFGTNKDPSVVESLQLLRRLGSRIIITKFDSRQDEVRTPIEPALLAEHARKVGFSSIQVEPDYHKALDLLIKGTSQIGLVTGSFYLLHHVREIVFAD